MHHVSSVERVDGCRVLIRSGRASRAEGVDVVVGGRALRGGTGGRRGLVCENVVAGGRGGRGGTILVPAVRRGGRVMRVGQSLEAIVRALRGEGNNTVLHPKGGHSQKLAEENNKESTHASIGDERHNVDDFARVGIDECLIPLLGLVVLDLDDVGKDNVVGVLGEILESSGPVVVLATGSSFSLGNCSLLGQLGGGRRNSLCKMRIFGECMRGYNKIRYVLGLMKLAPKETTFSPLRATFATAFATGIPLIFCLKYSFDTTSEVWPDLRASASEATPSFSSRNALAASSMVPARPRLVSGWSTPSVP